MYIGHFDRLNASVVLLIPCTFGLRVNIIQYLVPDLMLVTLTYILWIRDFDLDRQDHIIIHEYHVLEL